MSAPTPPRLARALLRLVPLGDRRAEVRADLLEASARRAASGGARFARRRFYADVVSLALRGPFRWRVPMPRPAAWPRDAAADATYALRVFRRQPGSVAIAVAGLSVAIAICTSVFSLVNAVFLRPYGMADPDSVFRVPRAHQSGTSTVWAYGDYLRLRASTTATIVAVRSEPLRVAEAEDDEQAAFQPVMFASDGYLQMLGARAIHGRLLGPADVAPGAEPAAVVSYAYWTSRLRADPDLAGRRIWLSGAPVAIVGVAARGISGPSDQPPAFWLPLGAYSRIRRTPEVFTQTSAAPVSVFARLGPGVSRERAQAELRGISDAIAAAPLVASSDPIQGLLARLDPVDDRFTGENAGVFRAVIAVIVTVLGLVLLLACANVANLQLASAAGRRREFGLRLALGAGRARVARQVIVESLLLGGAGGAVGLVLTWWLLPIISSMALAPPSFDVMPDVRVYLFLTAACVFAGLAAGLAPTRLAVRASLLAPLQGRGTHGAQPMRVRSLLVGVQAAASIMLLVLAALLARAMFHAGRLDLGFDADQLVLVAPDFPPDDTPARAARFFPDALDRVRGLPGVDGFALATHPPFGGTRTSTNLKLDGRPFEVDQNATSPAYFETVGLRILQGRVYTEADAAASAAVVVVSQHLARAFWGDDDPVGRELGHLPGVNGRAIVIGVVSDATTRRLSERDSAMVYQPLTKAHLPTAQLVVRSGATAALVRPLERALDDVDPAIRASAARVTAAVEAQRQESRVLASMSALIGAIALGLSVIGLFGVTALVAGQRTREIGVRMAIGATRADVRRLLLRDSLRPVAIGLAIGLTGALAAGQVIGSVLYGVSARDPLAVSSALLILCAAAAAAVILPVQRATRIDPARTLRSE